MRMALVHDWLNQKVGGGERVLLKLAAMFPDAPIYTLLYEPRKFGKLLSPQRVSASFLQKLPPQARQRPRYLLPLIPRAIESFDFSGFDVVLSSSVAFTKNIKTGPGTLHICYCHSPMRFAWDYWPRYLEEQNLGLLRQKVVTALVNKLRRWDEQGTAGVDGWLANSRTAAARIAKYYHRRARIIYPPVETDFFSAAAKTKKQNYYVTLSALTPYKKLDLAIAAFNISGERLVIIGEGSQRKQLQAMAKPNISFTGYLSEQRRRELVARAQALIVPQEEDFGIAPVEAMAAATPVIAYGKGGVTESVVNASTGLFFYEQTVAALNEAVEQAKTLAFTPSTLIRQAKKFDERIFENQIKQYIQQAYSRYVK